MKHTILSVVLPSITNLRAPQLNCNICLGIATMERLYSKGYGQGKSIFQKGWEAMNKEWIFYILTKRGENDKK